MTTTALDVLMRAERSGFNQTFPIRKTETIVNIPIIVNKHYNVKRDGDTWIPIALSWKGSYDDLDPKYVIHITIGGSKLWSYPLSLLMTFGSTSCHVDPVDQMTVYTITIPRWLFFASSFNIVSVTNLRSLPLVAFAFHEVSFSIRTIEPIDEDNPEMPPPLEDPKYQDLTLHAEYLYFTTDIRRNIAQSQDKHITMRDIRNVVFSKTLEKTSKEYEIIVEQNNYAYGFILECNQPIQRLTICLEEKEKVLKSLDGCFLQECLVPSSFVNYCSEDYMINKKNVQQLCKDLDIVSDVAPTILSFLVKNPKKTYAYWIPMERERDIKSEGSEIQSFLAMTQIKHLIMQCTLSKSSDSFNGNVYCVGLNLFRSMSGMGGKMYA
jgi:hypothetical protein